MERLAHSLRANNSLDDTDGQDSFTTLQSRPSFFAHATSTEAVIIPYPHPWNQSRGPRFGNAKHCFRMLAPCRRRSAGWSLNLHLPLSLFNRRIWLFRSTTMVQNLRQRLVCSSLAWLPLSSILVTLQLQSPERLVTCICSLLRRVIRRPALAPEASKGLGQLPASWMVTVCPKSFEPGLSSNMLWARAQSAWSSMTAMPCFLSLDNGR